MDLVTIFIITILLVPLIIFTDGAVRTALGLILVLFSPGYTLLAALFTRKTEIQIVPRLIYSVAISITLLVVFLLILDVTPWGIELYPGLIFLVSFTCIASLIAGWRRYRLDPEERYQPSFNVFAQLPRFWIEKSQFDRALVGILVIVVIGVIGTIGYIVATPMEGEKYTEFYLLDLDKKVTYYPDELAPGEEGEIIIGIVNHELETTVYSVEILLQGEMINDIGPISLEQDEKWEKEVSIVPSAQGPEQKVEFLLYKENRQLYRTLHIWIDVTEEVA